jgi:hypothetical protein
MNNTRFEPKEQERVLRHFGAWAAAHIDVAALEVTDADKVFADLVSDYLAENHIGGTEASTGPRCVRCGINLVMREGNICKTCQ